MGVDISDLIEAKKISLEDLAGRSIAIDAFNTLYQFLSMIRQQDGTPLIDREGRVTSHLSGLFFRSAALLEIGIRPVFVFDGEAPELKRKTIMERVAAKRQAEKEWKEALEKGELKKAFSRATRTARLTDTMIDESAALLDALGIPWLKAPSEGEAQMAHMVSKGDVWAGASQDFDALLFGSPILVRYLTLAGKRRLPSGKKVDVSPEIITLSEVLGALQITREQLVDMGILVGTDFNYGVKGIGPKKALKFIKEYGTLERVMEEKAKDLWGGVEGFKEIRKIFLQPNVDETVRPDWGTIVKDDIKDFLCKERDFSEERVEATLKKLDIVKETRAQTSLDSFFG